MYEIEKLNNCALLEITYKTPFGYTYKYYHLVYIHQFNSVWTVILVFDLKQGKLTTPRIVENDCIFGFDKRLVSINKLALGFLYLLREFNNDLIYFIKHYSTIRYERIEVIQTFRYTISKKAKEHIYYYLTQVI